MKILKKISNRIAAESYYRALCRFFKKKSIKYCVEQGAPKGSRSLMLSMGYRDVPYTMHVSLNTNTLEIYMYTMICRTDPMKLTEMAVAACHCNRFCRIGNLFVNPQNRYVYHTLTQPINGITPSDEYFEYLIQSLAKDTDYLNDALVELNNGNVSLEVFLKGGE